MNNYYYEIYEAGNDCGEECDNCGDDLNSHKVCGICNQCEKGGCWCQTEER